MDAVANGEAPIDAALRVGAIRSNVPRRSFVANKIAAMDAELNELFAADENDQDGEANQDENTPLDTSLSHHALLSAAPPSNTNRRNSLFSTLPSGRFANTPSTRRHSFLGNGSNARAAQSSRQFDNRSAAANRQNRRNSMSKLTSGRKITVDNVGHAVTEEELIALRREHGMCIRCGLVRTHQKVKYGPFNQFRKIEPLTIQNRVYQGYCRNCYDMDEIQMELQTENGDHTAVLDEGGGGLETLQETSERDVDFTQEMAAPFNQYNETDSPYVSNIALDSGFEDEEYRDEDEPMNAPHVLSPADYATHLVTNDWYDDDDDQTNQLLKFRSHWMTQTCAFVLCLVVFLAVVVFSLVAFLDDDNARNALRQRTEAPTGTPTIMPSSAPTQFLWVPMGDDIFPIEGEMATSGDGFGAHVMLSRAGHRLAVTAPKYKDFSGWLQVYEYTTPDDDGVGDPEWVPLGSPITGNNPGDAVGMSMDFSADGSTVAVGFPGNGVGYVQVFGYMGGGTKDWIQLGQDLTGVETGEGFGTSVSVTGDGTSLAVGSPNYSHVNSQGVLLERSGRVTGYGFSQAFWHEVGPSVKGITGGAHLGSTVCMADDRSHFIAGAPGVVETKGALIAYVYGPDKDDLGKHIDHAFLADVDSSLEEFQLVERFIWLGKRDDLGSKMACNGEAVHAVVRVNKEEKEEVVLVTFGVKGGMEAFPNIDPAVDEGHGNAVDVNNYASRNDAVIVSAFKNQEGIVGGIRVVQPRGLYGTVNTIGQTLGEDARVGNDEWITGGPSVSLSGDGQLLAIGFESIMTNDGISTSMVRVYSFGATTVSLLNSDGNSSFAA
eukprot:CAMPEP_0118716604 /NCGR_PEP_ID=MMETSP0800-20121206/27591_1 /TAXON_ID=210618 ORGANISM="Striatella unipunctata, Strain CCMP2910" /NCGR_SAMPLE_ID=MMETSP0800 /ASSEMBLY_ACC=CAM_ASM_000638 /LENGTH=830 /DNA_ID=CAMNT_0006623039 /DNA_START=102 /DNA_END=2594 /DNA_ORIENTATION=-